MIHTVKGFSIVNETDVFLEFSCFFYKPLDVGNLISGSSFFLNPAWTSGSSLFTYYWSLAWIILIFPLLACAAAAKSLQLCLTLCDHIGGSLLGSPIPGILQARALEWVAISFSNAWKWKVKVKSFSHVQLLATPWTAAHQAPPSMGFPRQEYWSGVPLPSPASMWDECNCVGVNILWHCLSSELEWKLTFSSPVATAEFSKFADMLNAALSQHHLLEFEIAQLDFHHLH